MKFQDKVELLKAIVKDEPMFIGQVEKICPHCMSEDITYHGGRQTLVGWIGNGPDPNHKWGEWTCKSCTRNFTVETYGEYAWITEQHVADYPKVIKGFPACFESYLMTCRACSGSVRRHNIDFKGKNTGSTVYYKDGKPACINLYMCEDCGNAITVKD